MLRKSFVHIPLVGEKREQYLWRKGLVDWYEAKERYSEIRIPKKAFENIKREVDNSIEAYEAKDYSYFLNAFNIKNAHLYRLYPYLKGKILYLDIETNMQHPVKESISVIGCYDGDSPKAFIQGRNLDDFEEYIKDFSLIVTFNGTHFDIPFLEKSLNIEITMPHIDLRWALNRLGYEGGLKKIEKEAGLERPSEVCELDGYAAVILWDEYARGRGEDFLNTLVYYNMEDTINLEYLLYLVYNENVSKMGFEECCVEKPVIPKIEYEYSPSVIEKVVKLRSGKYFVRTPKKSNSKRKKNFKH